MPHQRAIMVSSFLFVFALGFIVFVNLYDINKAYGAASGDYRSIATGNWNATSTWERYNGSAWVAASATPTSAAGVISIQSGHTVSVTANVTVDQVVVDAGGILTNSAATLTVANGTGSDLDVSGTVNLNTGGTVTISSSALITILSGGTWNYNGGNETTTGGWAVNNGGTYIHNVNNVDVPNATWGASSTLKITGVTNISPDVQYQTFGNIIYDCPSQTGNLNFRDKLTTINGDFTVVSTGTGTLKFDMSASAVTTTVAGNYSHTGGTFKITTMGNWNLNVGGNFTISGGTFILAGSDGVPNLAITGNININGGTLDMSQYTGAVANMGVGTINLSGNFIQTAGTVTETATNVGKGAINFAKAGTQTYDISGGSITNTIDFTVNSGSIVNAFANLFTGSGSFTLASGGGIILGHTGGISSSGATGNIQVTGTRTFSTGGNYTYNGTAAQISGSGLPSQVNNFTMNNASGLTLTNSVIVATTLTFTSGNITTNANVLTLGTSQASSNLGTLVRTTGHVIGYIKRWMSSSSPANVLFPVGTTTSYNGFTLSYTSIPSGGTITATFIRENPTLNGISYDDDGFLICTFGMWGYWEMVPADGFGGGTYNASAQANGFPGIGDYTTIHLSYRTDGGGNWSKNGTHAAGTGSNENPVANRTSGSSLGQFGIGGGNGMNPLPIELVFFNAKPSGTSVICTWQTATESNNDYFTVERSLDGTYFSTVGTVDGAGNSTTSLNYSFEDKEVSPTLLYYRLRQTDLDGRYTFSKIQSVTFKQSGFSDLLSIGSVSPNPFKEKFSLTYSVPSNAPVVISVMNSSGQKVFEQRRDSVKGINRFDFEEGLKLPQGIYFVKLSMNNQMQIKKIVKN